MRLRKKPWARPELEACNFFVQTQKNIKENGVVHLKMKE